MGLSITDLKKGTIFQLDGSPYKVLEYRQKVIGRGGSIVNVKIRNLVDGKVIDKTFKGSEQVEPADVASQKLQYLYSDSQQYYFMDPESYEQFALAAELMEGKAGYIREGDNVTAQLFGGRVINIELPNNVQLKVTYTEDAVRGDTSTAISKDATLETGLTVKVPAFIKQGDVLSVDTSTGAYRERIKS
jgi:elongation factor P